MFSQSTVAWQEVEFLVEMQQRTGESADAIRLLIGNETKFRRAVLARFDAVTAAGMTPSQIRARFKIPIHTGRTTDVRPRRRERHSHRVGRVASRFNSETLARATEMLKAGATWAVVAKHFSVSRSLLRKLIPWRRNTGLSDQQKALVKREFGRGRNALEIARALHLSPHHVYRLRGELRKEAIGHRRTA
jgi:DNA-binding CsgD family transcriptional regulator